MIRLLGNLAVPCLLALLVTSGCSGSDDADGAAEGELVYESVPQDLCNRLSLTRIVKDHGYAVTRESDDSSFGSPTMNSDCLLDVTDAEAPRNRGQLLVRLEALEGADAAVDRYGVFADDPAELGPTTWQLERSTDSPDGWWEDASIETQVRKHPTKSRLEKHSHEYLLRDDNLVVRVWLVEDLVQRRQGPERADDLINEVVKSMHTLVTSRD